MGGVQPHPPIDTGLLLLLLLLLLLWLVPLKRHMQLFLELFCGPARLPTSSVLMSQHVISHCTKLYNTHFRKKKLAVKLPIFFLLLSSFQHTKTGQDEVFQVKRKQQRKISNY